MEQSIEEEMDSVTFGKKPKKLGEDASGLLVKRLYEDQPRRREAWLNNQTAKLIEADKSRSRTMTLEEQEEAVGRLYQQEVDVRAEHREALRVKYVPDQRAIDEARAKPIEQIEEAVKRLATDCMISHAKSHQRLTQHYAPEFESRQLTAAEQQQSANRLHDESTAHAKETTEKLCKDYLDRDKGRFAGATTLTKDGWKEMGERLCPK
jgi:hypothetical protein